MKIVILAIKIKKKKPKSQIITIVRIITLSFLIYNAQFFKKMCHHTNIVIPV